MAAFMSIIKYTMSLEEGKGGKPIDDRYIGPQGIVLNFTLLLFELFSDFLHLQLEIFRD